VIGDAVGLAGAGLAAGVLSGLLGVGGGVLFVPALAFFAGLDQISAEATSLLAIVPVALVGSWLQAREGAVRWWDAAVIGVVSIAGALAGAALAEAMSGRALRLIFACVLVLTALQLTWRALRAPSAAAGPGAGGRRPVRR
jgi:uncharacterized membrane protein YfcA